MITRVARLRRGRRARVRVAEVSAASTPTGRTTMTMFIAIMATGMKKGNSLRMDRETKVLNLVQQGATSQLACPCAAPCISDQFHAGIGRYEGAVPLIQFRRFEQLSSPNTCASHCSCSLPCSCTYYPGSSPSSCTYHPLAVLMHAKTTTAA